MPPPDVMSMPGQRRQPLSITASIYHLTHYKYDRPVILGPQSIRRRIS